MYFSYTALKNLSLCPKRFKFYATYKLGLLPSPALEFGSKKHEDFEYRLLNNLPANDFQKELFNKLHNKYSFFIFEKYIANVKYQIHGVIDVVMHDLETDTIDILELKTGKYDIEQLYLYKILTDAKTIYLVNLVQNTIEEIEIDEDTAKSWILKMANKANEIVNMPLEQVPMQAGTHCSSCPFAKHCTAGVNIDVVSKETLPQALDLYHQLKARLKLLEHMIKEVVENEGGNMKIGNYHVYFDEVPYYRLSRTLTKEDLIKRIVQENKLELLDVKTKDAASVYPHLFKELKRKVLKIEENGGVKNDKEIWN